MRCNEARELIHGTAFVVEARAVLLLGASGSGKSDLACRAVTQPVLLGGRLISAALLADDQVLLERIGTTVVVRAPETIRGLIELRGLGIATLPPAAPAPLALVVQLVPSAEIARLPEPAAFPILGLQIPLIHIDPALPSAVARIMLAVSGMIDGLGMAATVTSAPRQ